MARMAGFGLGMMLVVMVAVVPSFATFVVEENSLTVSSPDSLKGVYQSAIGNFGVPQYGGTLSGIVKYAAINGKACEDFPARYFKAETAAGARPYFALVERGGNLPSPSPFFRSLAMPSEFHLRFIFLDFSSLMASQIGFVGCPSRLISVS